MSIESGNHRIRIKQGAVIQGLHIEMHRVLKLVPKVWAEFGYLPWAAVTSGLDGEHGWDSLHPFGRAVDLRTWKNDAGEQIDLPTKQKMARRLQTLLGTDYDVVVEGDHIHVEYDPAGG